LGAPHARAQCRAPHYRVGKINKFAAPAVYLDIAIKQEDFARDKLICLANILQRKYGGPEISVRIFDSYEAALNYHPMAEYTRNEASWQSRQHALYYYNGAKHEEYVLLIPDGLRSAHSSFDTRIDLPLTARPLCRLEIHNRCLLMFDHIGATTESGSGTVTLTAQIEKSGRVINVRVADPGSITSGQLHALGDFAVRNLKSWRFEQGQNKENLRITYSLERVDKALEHGVNVEFLLPERVNIQMGPQLMSR
jgi:hypothetical protein